MRHTNVSKIDQGFTLPELMIVVVFVGILAAIAAPGFLAWNQNKQADEAMTTVEGAIKEAQRQAMAKSRECNVSFTTASNTPTISSIDDSDVGNRGNCLVTGNRTLKNVRMEVSTNDSSLTSTGSFYFSQIGDTAPDPRNFTTPPPIQPITVVLTHSGNTNLRRCVVVSYPLGLVGTGEYTGNAGSISNRCVKQ